MNELLQKHGCSNVFTIPNGLKELMNDISREVLRDQPPKIYDYIANYLSVLIITREHGILAVKILEDLCDCRPTVSEHLLEIGIDREQADMIAEVIKEEVEQNEPSEGKEKVKEAIILKKVLTKAVLDEELSAKVCQVARNAYRDYWYRKKIIEKHLKVHPDAPWEIAAQRTLELYKKTKPSFSELTRATQKIQAAYRGYYTRRNVLKHLKPAKVKKSAKVDLPGPPLDLSGSRDIDLGPVIILNVREENVNEIFENRESEKLGLQYHPMKTITHVAEAFFDSFRPPSFDDIPAPSKKPDRAHSYTAGMPVKPSDQSEATSRRASHTGYEATEADQAPKIFFAEAPVSHPIIATAEVTPRRSRVSYMTSPTPPPKMIIADAAKSRPRAASADVTPRRSHVSFEMSPYALTTAQTSVQKIIFGDAAIPRPIIETAEVTPRGSHDSYVTSPSPQSTAAQKMVIADKPVLDTEVLEDLQQDLSERTGADDGDYSVPTDTSPSPRAPSPSDVVTDAEDIPEDLPDNDDEHTT